MCFNIAEGIARGWATGNAETWYKLGITESMAFYGIDVTKTSFTAYFLPKGANSVTQVAPYPFNFDFTTYYAQPSVALSPVPAQPSTRLFYKSISPVFKIRDMNPIITGEEPGFRLLKVEAV